jgi:hypothetical protein
MADVTLLRTLTRKSLLKYGRHYQSTVAEMIASHPWELVIDYYSLEAITFEDSILDEILIPQDKRIAKPGKLGPERWELIRPIRRALLDKLKEEVGEKNYMARVANIRTNYVKMASVKASKAAWRSKAYQQSKNHGK